MYWAATLEMAGCTPTSLKEIVKFPKRDKLNQVKPFKLRQLSGWGDTNLKRNQTRLTASKTTKSTNPEAQSQ
jgi:hypothetical protein